MKRASTASLVLLHACAVSSPEPLVPQVIQIWAHDTAPTTARPLSFCAFALPNCPATGRLIDLCSLTPVRTVGPDTRNIQTFPLGLGLPSGPLVVCRDVPTDEPEVYLMFNRHGFARVSGQLVPCGDWTLGTYFTTTPDSRPPTADIWWVRSATISATPIVCSGEGAVSSNPDESDLPADIGCFQGSYTTSAKNLIVDSSNPWDQPPIAEAGFVCPSPR
jgi:hypothetical protein